MASIDELNAALVKADQAGDTQSAQIFANQIKQMRQPTVGGIADLIRGGPAPNDQNAAGQKVGGDTNPLMAGAAQFAQQAIPFDNYINAGAIYAAQHLLGKGQGGAKTPNTYDEDLAYARGTSQGEAEKHPIASGIGGTAGAIDQAILGGRALNALGRAVPVVGRVLTAVGPVSGQGVRNTIKAFSTGATIGTAQGIASGQDKPQAALTGAVSGGVGVVAGPVASWALNKLAGPSQRAIMALADHFGGKAVVEKAYDSFLKLTGQVPSMAQLADLKTQGKLQALAADNATIGEAAAKAANAGGAPLHEQLAAANSATRPQTAAGQTDFRDVQMNDVMNMPHPQTGVKLKDTPVPDPTGILADPHVEYALRPNTAINARIGQTSPVLQRVATGSATIEDVEIIRKALRDQQNSLMRPAPGSQNSRDPLLAKEFADVASKVEGLGIKADPDYGKALNQYRGLSHYTDGFQHGLTGRAMADVPQGDSLTSKALTTPMGIAGYEHGNALATAQQALERIAPGTVHPQQTAGVQQAGQATMAAVSHPGSVFQVYHAMKAAVPGLHLPEAVQQHVAKMLFSQDPRIVRQGIANLARGKASADDIRRLGAILGGTAAAQVGSYLSQGGAQ